MLLITAKMKSRQFRWRKMRSAAMARREGRLRPLRAAQPLILFRSGNNLFPERNYEAYVIERADRIVGSGNLEIRRKHQTAGAEIVADNRTGSPETGHGVTNCPATDLNR